MTYRQGHQKHSTRVMARETRKTSQQASGTTEATPFNANQIAKLKVFISKIDKNLQ